MHNLLLVWYCDQNQKWKLINWSLHVSVAFYCIAKPSWRVIFWVCLQSWDFFGYKSRNFWVDNSEVVIFCYKVWPSVRLPPCLTLPPMWVGPLVLLYNIFVWNVSIPKDSEWLVQLKEVVDRKWIFPVNCGSLIFDWSFILYLTVFNLECFDHYVQT